MTRSIALAGLVALAVAPAPAVADDASAALADYMKAAVAALDFTGSVVVTRGEETLLEAGYGLANVEHRVPNTPATKFRLGSVTKQFTAMAVMILRDRGRLDLDDPIGRHLDDAPEAWGGVTIRHLLNHTSGIPSYTNDPKYRDEMMIPKARSAMIAGFRDEPLEFEPGSKFAYSNSGYFLLGAIVEEVSGKPYEAFLREEVFGPLGMDDSGYDRPEVVLAHRASGYDLDADGPRNAAYLDASQPYSAGSLYSTVEDLARWDRALDRQELISPESYEALFAPARDDFACGWVVRDREGHREQSHGGAINGFMSFVARYPDDDLFVAVLANAMPMPTERIARDLAAVVLGLPYEAPKASVVAEVAPEVLDSYRGRYRIDDEMTLTITREGARLVAEPTGQPRVGLVPESDVDFFIKAADIRLTFVKGDDGKAAKILIHLPGREDEAVRIDEAEEAPRR